MSRRQARELALLYLHRVATALPRPGAATDTNVLRLERWGDSVTVTDVTNIGKRGKKVLYFTMGPLRYLEEQQPEVYQRFLEDLLKAPTYSDALRLAEALKAEYAGQGYAFNFDVSESEKRGVDVKPVPLRVDGTRLRGFVEVDGFSLSAKRGTYEGNVEPHIEAGRSAKKPQLRKVYVWAQKNKSQLGDMELGAVLAEIQETGCPVSAKGVRPVAEPPPVAEVMPEQPDRGNEAVHRIVDQLRVGDKIEVEVRVWRRGDAGWMVKKIKTEVLGTYKTPHGPAVNLKSRARGGARISTPLGFGGTGRGKSTMYYQSGRTEYPVQSVRKL
jgi:hypothetical protein